MGQGSQTTECTGGHKLLIVVDETTNQEHVNDLKETPDSDQPQVKSDSARAGGPPTSAEWQDNGHDKQSGYAQNADVDTSFVSGPTKPQHAVQQHGWKHDGCKEEADKVDERQSVGRDVNQFNLKDDLDGWKNVHTLP